MIWTPGWERYIGGRWMDTRKHGARIIRPPSLPLITWVTFTLIKTSWAKRKKYIGGRWMDTRKYGVRTIPLYSVLSTTYACLMPVEVGIWKWKKNIRGRLIEAMEHTTTHVSRYHLSWDTRRPKTLVSRHCQSQDTVSQLHGADVFIPVEVSNTHPTRVQRARRNISDFWAASFKSHLICEEPRWRGPYQDRGTGLHRGMDLGSEV